MDKARLWLRFLFLLFSILRFASAQAPAVPGGQATTAGPGLLPRGWLKAASLRPGEPLSVRVRPDRTPTLCTLVWIDTVALACNAEATSGGEHRLIFPVAQVSSVERDRTAESPEGCGEAKRLLIAAGAGSLVGGLILGQTSGRAGALGAMLGAGFGVGLVAGGGALGAPVRPPLSLRVPLRRAGRRSFP